MSGDSAGWQQVFAYSLCVCVCVCVTFTGWNDIYIRMFVQPNETLLALFGHRCRSSWIECGGESRTEEIVIRNKWINLKKGAEIFRTSRCHLKFWDPQWWNSACFVKWAHKFRRHRTCRCPGFGHSWTQWQIFFMYMCESLYNWYS
jgi:hypothetical protein